MRTWSKYLNSQKYSECQVVTALNAYYYLTGKIYCEQNSQEYENLVNLCCARNGAAISIEKVHKKLGLKIIGYSTYLSTMTETEWYKLEALKKLIKGRHPKDLPKRIRRKIRLPIEIKVWHKITGYHSILIVDHCLKSETYRIANFRYETSTKGWMFAEDLYKFTTDMNEGWVFRLFGLEK